VDHQLSETQELLRNTAAEFFAREYPLERMREVYASPDGWDERMWRSLQALGWDSAPFPESVGGFEGSFLEASVLLEELGKACAATPFPHSSIAAGLALVESEPSLVEEIAAGTRTVMPVSWGDVRADRDRVSGGLRAVPFAAQATDLLLAVDGRAVLVAMGEGVRLERLRSAGLQPSYVVTLDGALATTVGNESTLAALQAFGAAATALILLGASETALDLAVNYARERIQFERPIGSFQALQHRMADMHIDIEIGRNLAYKAAWQHSVGESFSESARHAKSWLGDTAAFVTRQCLQIHGGVGVIDNHRAQLPYRFAMELNAAYGAPHDQRRELAGALLGD
jgi:alkylation response protein AidB-like acyl-CoA dehydrogenase